MWSERLSTSKQINKHERSLASGIVSHSASLCGCRVNLGGHASVGPLQQPFDKTLTAPPPQWHGKGSVLPYLPFELGRLARNNCQFNSTQCVRGEVDWRDNGTLGLQIKPIMARVIRNITATMTCVYYASQKRTVIVRKKGGGEVVILKTTYSLFW